MKEIKKNMKFLSFIVVSFLFIWSCKSNDTTTPESEGIISANQWKLDRFSDTNNKTLSTNQLNSSAIYIFALDFEFRADNVVRARERITKQIVNGGSWKFTADKTAINIDIPGLKGQFKVKELSRNKLILQAENNQLIDAGAVVNMEFVPIL